MRAIRFRAVTVLAVLGASSLVAVALGETRATDPDLKPPALLLPAPSASMQVGTAVVFRIRSHARDVGLMLRVSRSSVRRKCGAIRGEVGLYSFVRTGRPAVYESRPVGATLSTSWLSKPGTYYWQAYRIAGRDGCVESAVRSLQVIPKPPLALGEARIEGKFDVVSQITAVNGFGSKVGDTSKVTYTFEPSCASGPCDVTLSFGVSGGLVPVVKTVQIPLTRADSIYTGSGPATLSRCSFLDVTGTLEVRLEVGSGAWVGSGWRATSVVGHERYSTPESHGALQTCPPSSWEADLNGTLQGTSQLSR